MKIFVIGHKSPDLDCISSAIEYTEFLKKIGRYQDAEFVPARAGEPNNETVHIFKKFNVEMPVLIDTQQIDPEDRFILVDHNEEAQRSEKVDAEKIIEIVDHHKLNLSFTSPLRIDIRPLGSTSSIIYELFEVLRLIPSDHVSHLILASILSDTVGLKSSTTTGLDVTFVKNLSKKHDVDVEKLTFDIFSAKSDISGLSAKQVVNKDFKIFDFSGKKVFIGQVETVEPGVVIKDKTNLIKALEEAKVEQGTSQAYLFITDILKVNSYALFSTKEEQEIIEKAFTTQGKDWVADIGPKISRKKDIAPEIERVLN